MEFSFLMHGIIYCEGFFCTHVIFMRGFLKACIGDKLVPNYSDSALKGFLRGDSITNFAHVLMQNKLSKQSIQSYIESIYKLQHKDSKTYNDRYGDQLYEDVLYEKAKGVFKDITPESMSSVLADAIYHVITEANNEYNSLHKAGNSSESGSNDADDSKLLYTWTEDKKQDVLKCCKKTRDTLHSLEWQAESIVSKRDTIQKETAQNADVLWIKHLQADLESKEKGWQSTFSTLKTHCANLTSFLLGKEHLDDAMQSVSDYANDIGNPRYNILNPDTFVYSSFNLMVSRFTKSLNQLQRTIQE